MSKTKSIKVSVEERKPEAEKRVLATWNTGESGFVVINENGYWYSFEAESECDEPDFWFDEVPDREEEMREMLERILDFSKKGLVYGAYRIEQLLNELKQTT